MNKKMIALVLAGCMAMATQPIGWVAAARADDVTTPTDLAPVPPVEQPAPEAPAEPMPVEPAAPAVSEAVTVEVQPVEEQTPAEAPVEEPAAEPEVIEEVEEVEEDEMTFADKLTAMGTAYVVTSGETKVYENKRLTKLAGKVGGNAILYATDVEQDAVAVTFADEAGNVVKGFVKINRLKDDLLTVDAGAAKVSSGSYVKNGSIFLSMVDFEAEAPAAEPEQTATIEEVTEETEVVEEVTEEVAEETEVVEEVTEEVAEETEAIEEVTEEVAEETEVVEEVTEEVAEETEVVEEVTEEVAEETEVVEEVTEEVAEETEVVEEVTEEVAEETEVIEEVTEEVAEETEVVEEIIEEVAEETEVVEEIIEEVAEETEVIEEIIEEVAEETEVVEEIIEEVAEVLPEIQLAISMKMPNGQSTLFEGDRLTLTAEILNGSEIGEHAIYFVWQYSDDGANWTTLEGADTQVIEVVVRLDDNGRQWRVGADYVNAAEEVDAE